MARTGVGCLRWGFGEFAKTKENIECTCLPKADEADMVELSGMNDGDLEPCRGPRKNTLLRSLADTLARHWQQEVPITGEGRPGPDEMGKVVRVAHRCACR